MIINYTINEKDANKNLRSIIKDKLYISAILLNKLKNTQSILVNDEVQYMNYRVVSRDNITINFDKMNMELNNNENGFREKYKLWDKEINILYEDEYLLIVDKESGIPIHPCASNHETTLANAVMNYFKNTSQNIFSIHVITRLDKDTSGICIFAKNEYIQELFIRKKDVLNFKKEYIAIVNGIVEKDHDIIEKNIARKQGTIILREVNPLGDYAKTEYFVESRNHEKNYTILKVILHTGRTHQIRVHMASIGHVLLGDELYAKEYGIDNIHKYISRQALHCRKVGFRHPVTEEYLQFYTKLPLDMLLCKNSDMK